MVLLLLQLPALHLTASPPPLPHAPLLLRLRLLQMLSVLCQSSC
jgi:hypothetical protein